MDEWKPQNLHFAQARCGICGLLIAQPQADSNAMVRYYGELYYDRVSAQENFALALSVHSRCEMPLIRQLWRDWPPPQKATLAEIGCGNGAFLKLFIDAGYTIRGAELGAQAVDFCRAQGLDVVQGDASSLICAEGYDVVLANQVIEHVPDPQAFACDMVSLAKPGGVVVILTEDAAASQYRWQHLSSRLSLRIPRFQTSSDHTFVFRDCHLRTLLMRAWCCDVRTKSLTHPAPPESLHWKLYKGTFRLLDRFLGHGIFLMAVARRTS